ncbi:MAG: GNAT family N-acetyltransferase [Candidatus Cloacimonadales bacterium]
MKIIIREPNSAAELEQYYYLRWQLLRQPWQQPRGSEQDEHENIAKKVMALDEAEIIGVGRIHQIAEQTWQIRYMAVKEAYRGQKVGRKILHKLETLAHEQAASEIVLEARAGAVEFYQKNGYRKLKPGKNLYAEIPHFWMQKKL